MRYEDSSQTGAFSNDSAGQTPEARDDSDALAAGARGPATGNVISGDGTQFGPASSDLSATDAHIIAIAGAGGQDSSFAGGKLNVAGEFGKLSIDANGNYSYLANQGAPENSRDRFTYTLADKQGNSDTAALTIEIGKTPVVIQANAQQVVVGPDGVVVLPAGVELSDIHVVGRNLVIDLPDGGQMVIVDGAVFVPQLVLGGVEVPATNLAALLIDSEPRPAAGGEPPSSGGNFEVPVGPLDPGVPLGDLIPPTELDYTPPEVRELFDVLDRDPTIAIDPGNGIPVENAIDSVNEAGLPARNEGEPEGSGEEAAAGANGDPSEATTGTIVYDSPDNPNTITIDGLGAGSLVFNANDQSAVGQTIAGQYGTLTITSVANGVIGYSYTLTDNTGGNNTSDPFTVVITDNDGDSDTATLTINIVDDVPTARPDTDSIASGEYGPATGNVITDASAGDAGDGDTNAADTVGADDATLSSVSGVNSDSTFDEGGNLVVNGQYGVLTIDAQGNYSYVRNPGTDGGVTDVFNYTLTDGDGDTTTSTLTINIADATPLAGENLTARLDDDTLSGGIAGGVDDDVDAENLSGNLAASGGDGPLSYDLLLTGAPAGFTYVDGPDGSVLVKQGGVTVLTVTIDAATGAYTVTQNAPIDHPTGSDENNVDFTINYRVTDQDGDFDDGTLNINVDDDTPTIGREDVSLPTLHVDETVLATNATGDFSTVFDGQYGADGPGTTGYAVSVVNGTDSGLVDVATGDSIFLFNNAGVVEGRVGGVDGAVSFTVSVNADTGVVTLDQVLALEHPVNPNPDDPVSPDATSIQLTATITDADGDPASLTVNIGGQLVFDDDGPTINPVLNADATVTVDESLPSGTPGINLGGITAGNDPDLAGGLAIGQANSGVAIVDANAVFGADGPAAGGGIGYALSITNVDSGVTLTDGTPIELQLVGGVIVGVVDGGTFDGQAAFAIAINPTTGVVTVEQYLSLDHPVNPNPDDPLGLGDDTVAVTVTATDGDGDPVTSDAIDVSGQITFLDDGPTIDPAVNAQATVQVDESLPSNIPAINTGAIVKGNDPDLSDATGTAIGQGNSGVAVVDANAVFGADGPAANGGLGYTLSITNADSGVTLTDGTPIELQLVGGVVVGVVDGGTFDGQAAFAIAIDPATGVVTVEQYLSLDHPVNPNPDDVLGLGDNTVAVTVTATDGDGDPVNSGALDISGQISFRDDGPTIDPVLDREATVQVDESLPSNVPGINTGAIVKGNDPDLSDATGTAIGQGNSGSAIVDANAVFGADGPAAGGGIGYALSITDVTSGVTLTDGSAINLQLVGGVIVGVVDGGTFDGQAAFAIAIDPATGVVTVEQYLSLDHPVNPDANDPLGLGDDTVAVTVTATDGDGDPVTSDAVDISHQITFLDDGPTVDPAVNADATVQVDESLPSGTPGINLGGITAGNDPDLAGGLALGQDNSGVAVVNANAVFGADGPAVQGSVTYALDILDVSSGLTLTDGTPIDLQMVNGVIVGVVDGGTFDGKAAFAIAINSTTGVVTVEQYLSLDHPVTTDSNDPLSFGEDVIGATVTATDGDGDPVTSDAVDIGGQLTFLDDGPVANNDVDSVVGGFDPATGNVLTGSEVAVGEDTNATDGVADAPGADGGTITLIDHASAPAEAVPGGGSVQIDGDYGTLTIDANGDYSYQRAPATPGGVNDVFTYTLTDGDGDSTTATLTISIDDRFPTLPDPDTIHLDDDVIPAVGGNLNGPGDDDPDAVPGNVANGQLNGTGGDAPLTYNFTGDDTLPTGFSIGAASDADTLLIVQQQSGNPVTVMTIQLDQSDGSFTVTQNAPILHDPTNPGAPADQVGNFEDNLNFSIGVEVEDADHDVEAAHITINIDDDTPTINVTQSGESAITLTTDDAQTIGVDSDTAQSTANFSGVFGLTQSAGADGTAAAATLAYALDVTGFVNGGPGGVNSGLESHDADIFLYEIGGKVVGSTSATLAGVLPGNTVFDVGVTSPGGVVTLTQYQQIDHDTVDPSPTGGPDYADHIVSLTDNLITLTASATLTDRDGDTISDSEVANIGANLRFTDDGPDAQTSATPVGSVTLDETRGEGSDRGPGDGAPNGDASNTIDFSANFLTGGSVDYGADGPGSATYALSLTATGSGLFALDGADTSATDGDGYGKGVEIQLSQVGNIISGKVGGTTYFTIEINPDTGVVTFSQVNNIWHPTPGTASFDETATLTMTTADLMKVIQTVTDFDGDTDTASINIGQGVFSIQDDGPQAIQPDDATVEDTAGESALGVALDDDGSLLGDFGTDLPGKITFANITPDGMATTETADEKPIELWLSADGQTLTGRTESTDGTDGTLIYTVHINADGTYDFTLNNPIDNGSGFEFNDLTSTKAGTTLVYGIGADDSGAPDIDAMLTGTHTGVNANVNTNATSIGIANQSFNPTDAIRIDFVTNMDTNAGTTIGFDYTAHVETNGYQQKVPQVVGNPSTVSFKVWAIESDDTQATYPDSNPAGGFGDDPTVTITEVWVVGHTVGEPKIDPVDISGLANGDTMAIAYGISVTRNADGSVTFSGVEQDDSYGIGTGSNDFNAVSVQDVTGKFDLGIFSLTTTNQGDPLHLAFDLNITDADGDTIVLTDAINVTVNPAGTDTLAASTMSVSESHVGGDDTSSFSSLLASDTLQVGKTAANNNTGIVAGVVAASGLMAMPAAAAETPHDQQAATSSESVQTVSQSSVAPVAEDHGNDHRSALTAEVHQAANDDSQASGLNHGHSLPVASAHGLAGAEVNHASAVSNLMAGTEHGGAQAASHAAAAPTIAMVSAEALAAAGLAGQGAQQGGSVEQVLADALGHGGAPTIDGLLHALGGHGNGGNSAIASLASPVAAHVPAWDMGSAGGFVPGADMMFKMDVAMLHHDAVQPVVNG